MVHISQEILNMKKPAFCLSLRIWSLTSWYESFSYTKNKINWIGILILFSNMTDHEMFSVSGATASPNLQRLFFGTFYLCFQEQSFFMNN